MHHLKRTALYSLVIFALVFSSCGGHNQLTEEINTQIDSLHNAVTIINNPQKFEKLDKSISAFIKKYPADTLSPAYLLEMGLIYQKQNRFNEAVAVLERLQTEYPDAKQNRIALFAEGFIYNNVIQDYMKARDKYNLYLKKYSAVDPKVTHDVQLELANIGKSPDELFKEMQKK